MDKSASSDAFSYDNANADVSTDKMREKTSKWEEVADNVAMLILKEFCMNYDEPQHMLKAMTPKEFMKRVDKHLKFFTIQGIRNEADK